MKPRKSDSARGADWCRLIRSLLYPRVQWRVPANAKGAPFFSL